MLNPLELRAVRRIVNEADRVGVEVPDDIRAMTVQHPNDRVTGATLWARLHPDDEQIRGCCHGEAIKGAEFCTCWVPVHDLTQADLIPLGDEHVQVRDTMCGDCAYRPESPEMAVEFLAEELREMPLRGATFWCHDGMRKIIRWEHPDGRTVEPTGDDYDPPYDALRRPYRADGRIGIMCAGWGACSRRWSNLLEKETA